MFRYKKFLISIGALTFSFGILTIGYGFWTDSLNIDGEAEVRFRMDVIDDIIEAEIVTPEALELDVNPESNSGGIEGGDVIEQPSAEPPQEPPADQMEPPTELEKPPEIVAPTVQEEPPPTENPEVPENPDKPDNTGGDLENPDDSKDETIKTEGVVSEGNN